MRLESGDKELFNLYSTYRVVCVNSNSDLCKQLNIENGDIVYIDLKIMQSQYDKYEKQFIINITNLNNNKSFDKIPLNVFATMITNIKLEKI